MNSRAFRRSAVAVAAFSASAIVLAGCAGGGGGQPSADSDEPITLTIATFNDFGYTDELLQEYMDENPNVTIVHNRAAESGDARANYFQKLGKEGLADIEAVEIDWFAEAMQYSDLLAEAPDSVKGRWLDWKEAAATDGDGRLVGFGTDIGPQGICYRADLFEAAGLPSDREGVAELFDGDWENFLDVADQYKEATGKPMIDSANSVLQGIVNQIEYTYTEPDGTVIATDNPEIQAAYELVTERAVPNSAYAGQWSDDWFASMANGEFATMLCPGWMLGVISGNAPDVTGWDIADVFPNGGGNWGGSYLTVPANGANVDAALALADWLTAPEQQVKAFTNAGTFPSQLEAYEDPTLTDATNEYFNDAPTGEILSTRAEAVTVAPFKDASYFKYHDALQNAVTRVFDGVEDEQTSWDTWVAEVEAF
ncbi:ABC transporter substrate-binding protein [Microbacterium gallinarum]|uniref:Carbohydrate ABC transporter substrate-binding protein n=1 Tax=Microbacterium gallinarum TaxID=2762209 RepID=A0ABR8X1A2_9MICO|nr:ABC transporter substrate-binding protein [Microbacterium gallinarum]MBD8023119.1 carbohydrate ABC transporter substrate-binding protein [Microbacterium gallinarum]